MDTGDTDSANSILITVLVAGISAMSNRQKRGKVPVLIKISY